MSNDNRNFVGRLHEYVVVCSYLSTCEHLFKLSSLAIGRLKCESKHRAATNTSTGSDNSTVLYAVSADFLLNNRSRSIYPNFWQLFLHAPCNEVFLDWFLSFLQMGTRSAVVSRSVNVLGNINRSRWPALTFARYSFRLRVA